jgi:hypothetical protein
MVQKQSRSITCRDHTNLWKVNDKDGQASDVLVTVAQLLERPFNAGKCSDRLLVSIFTADGLVGAGFARNVSVEVRMNGSFAG